MILNEFFNSHQTESTPAGGQEQLQAELDQLQKKFDPHYQHSDDYTFWSKQNRIAQRISVLKQLLAKGDQGVAEDTNSRLPSFLSYVLANSQGQFSDIEQIEDLFDYAYLSDLDLETIADGANEEGVSAIKWATPRMAWLLKNISDKSKLAVIKPLAASWLKTVSPAIDKYVKDVLNGQGLAESYDLDAFSGIKFLNPKTGKMGTFYYWSSMEGKNEAYSMITNKKLVPAHDDGTPMTWDEYKQALDRGNQGVAEGSEQQYAVTIDAIDHGVLAPVTVVASSPEEAKQKAIAGVKASMIKRGYELMVRSVSAKPKQGVTEGLNETDYPGQLDTSKLILRLIRYHPGPGYFDGPVYDNSGQYIGDLGFFPGGKLSSGKFSWPNKAVLSVKNPSDPHLQDYWEKMGKDKIGYGKFPLDYTITDLNDPLMKQAISQVEKLKQGVAEGFNFDEKKGRWEWDDGTSYDVSELTPAQKERVAKWKAANPGKRQGRATPDTRGEHTPHGSGAGPRVFEQGVAETKPEDSKIGGRYTPGEFDAKLGRIKARHQANPANTADLAARLQAAYKKQKPVSESTQQRKSLLKQILKG